MPTSANGCLLSLSIPLPRVASPMVACRAYLREDCLFSLPIPEPRVAAACFMSSCWWLPSGMFFLGLKVLEDRFPNKKLILNLHCEHRLSNIDIDPSYSPNIILNYSQFSSKMNLHYEALRFLAFSGLEAFTLNSILIILSIFSNSHLQNRRKTVQRNLINKKTRGV